MRFTTLILIISIMQVSASSFAQRITMSKKGIPLTEVLKEIKAQTGYDFVFNATTLKNANRVDIDVKNEELDKVLKQIFSSQPLTFSIDNRMVIVKEKMPSFLDRVASYFAAIDVRGVVLNDKGQPLAGATVRVKASGPDKSGGKSKQTFTNAKGEFFLNNIDEDATIQIVFIGYKTKELKAVRDLGSIRLEENVGELEQVDVTFNTGYQKIDPTKATGSFVLIDSALFNRRVGTNVLERLEGVTSGLNFNKNQSTGSGARNYSDISIRSRSTIFSNPDPLIILDNFPYDGDLSNLNPNDIENITILRDAAAASIWGAYSGNGVIVITTKTGKYNQSLRINANANVTATDKPDLFYSPQMSVSDYIELEKVLFSKGAFDGAINNINKATLSPVVELLLKNRNGQLTDKEANDQIEQLKSYDIRKDLLNEVYRPNINQQYAVNLSGGGEWNQYYYSVGFDRNFGNVKYNNYNRLTLNAKNSFSLVKDKLELNTEVLLVKSATQGANATYSTVPYERLLDDNGNALPVAVSLRKSYTDTAGAGKLKSWDYVPLDELALADNKTDLTDYRINASLKYNILSGLSAALLYQYSKGLTERTSYSSPNSYAMRALTNTFSQVTAAGVTSPIPEGGKLGYSNASYSGNNARAVLNYNTVLNRTHSVTALGGAEVRSVSTIMMNTDELYGYDESTNSSVPVNFYADYPQYITGGVARIPNIASNIPRRGFTKDNNISYFANTAYTYDSRYAITLSARKDQSNIFGVHTNQKGVPLWSAGVAWTISNEKFFNIDWLNLLKLRYTEGYNGNVNKNLSATTTAGSPSINYNNAPTLAIINPPNENLRWEKVHIRNIGIDFSGFNKRLSGSIEGYTKDGRDLIGQAPFDPTTGISSFSGNVSDMKGKGIDVMLNSVNFKGKLSWATNLIFSYAKDNVINYQFKQSNISQYLSFSYTTPLEGYPMYALFSYRWAGLDPMTGSPLGYLNGKLSNNYTGIINNVDFSTLVYHGTINPTTFGGIRNTFIYNHLSLSFNITYKFDYYFRRNSLDYSALLRTSAGLFPSSFNPDYALRWQKSGDEQHTNVPSLLYPLNSASASFYNNSEINVQRGDHIRLQDIRLEYSLGNDLKRLGVKSLQLYAYASNLGIIWRRNQYKIDPDRVPRIEVGNNISSVFPNPRAFAFGISIGL